MIFEESAPMLLKITAFTPVPWMMRSLMAILATAAWDKKEKKCTTPVLALTTLSWTQQPITSFQIYHPNQVAQLNLKDEAILPMYKQWWRVTQPILPCERHAVLLLFSMKSHSTVLSLAFICLWILAWKRLETTTLSMLLREFLSSSAECLRNLFYLKSFVNKIVIIPFIKKNPITYSYYCLLLLLSLYLLLLIRIYSRSKSYQALEDFYPDKT